MPIGSEILLSEDPTARRTWRVEYFDYKGRVLFDHLPPEDIFNNGAIS